MSKGEIGYRIFDAIIIIVYIFVITASILNEFYIMSVLLIAFFVFYAHSIIKEYKNNK